MKKNSRSFFSKIENTGNHISKFLKYYLKGGLEMAEDENLYEGRRDDDYHSQIMTI